MPILVGIDEAGYGPTLGPLVVSACVFRVPRPRLDLWATLAGTVCRHPAPDADHVVIDDSKRVYGTRRGLGVLEASVLACLSGHVPGPVSLARLLQAVGFDAQDALARYPWYGADTMTVPVAASQARIHRQSRRLEEALRLADVAFLGATTVPAFPAELNALFDRLGNKAFALYSLTARIMKQIWQSFGQEPMRIVLDKQGARRYYLPLLSATFAGQAIVRRRESPESSLYEIRQGDRRMTVEFRLGADRVELPVSLASMLSKYVRELFMRQFNAFWQGHVSDLRPTAGYPQDARRFLAAIRDEQGRLGLDSALFVRKR